MRTMDQKRILNVDQVISYTGQDIKEAMRRIQQPDVTLAACSLEHNTDFLAACASYEQFARSQNLTPASDCFYKLDGLKEDDKQNGLCFIHSGWLKGGEGEITQESDAYKKLLGFFSDIGFAQHNRRGVEIIIRQALANRQLLADLFPGTESDITTQINISSAFRLPHIHNDIGCGMTICGPTLIFVAPEESKVLPLKSYRASDSDLMFCYVSSDPKDVREPDGAMSIRRHRLVLFKGAKTAELPFGDPRNFDALHCSPADESGQPRMFIVSFVTPPGWGDMKIFDALIPSPVGK